jgi:YesN/AraC family two-component response regulator
VISVTNYINSHSKASDYIIDYITDYIENHYPEEIYLDLLAQKLGITSNYISSYFRDKVGTNFNYYLNNFRIKKSINLLSNSSFKIKDISEKVGYTNVNTFTRAFKKHFGKTPDEYRKNLI